MVKEIRQTQILNLLNDGPKTYSDIQKGIGKEIEIRDAMHVLLKEDRIQISGYENKGKKFNKNNVKFKKINPNIFAQLYIKNLIEMVHIENNFIELRRLFEKKIIKINKAYEIDETLLKDILDKMAIKEALNHIGSKEFYMDNRSGPNDNHIFIEKLQKYDIEYPDAQIWFFKSNRVFTLGLKKIFTISGGPPFYPVRLYLDKDGSLTKDDFIRSYFRTFDYLPIYPNFIDELFDKLIKYTLRIKIDKREDYQWELAELLSNDATVKKFAYFINNFIEKIENEEYVLPKYMEDPFL